MFLFVNWQYQVTGITRFRRLHTSSRRYHRATGQIRLPGRTQHKARKATMTSISALSSHHHHTSPLQRLQDELQTEVSSGAISSSDQSALSSALRDIDSALQSSSPSDQSSGRTSPSDTIKSKIDDLI